jgi:hypothetical protein
MKFTVRKNHYPHRGSRAFQRGCLSMSNSEFSHRGSRALNGESGCAGVHARIIPKSVFVRVRPCLSVFLILLTGCVTQNAKITEYDQSGKITKITETSQQDVIGKIMQEMEKKNIVIWKQGWFFLSEITLTGTETYMPCIKFAGGKVNSGHLSIKDGPEHIPSIVTAIQQPITVTATGSGIEIKESNEKKTPVNR